jgi:Na+/glutamate symporter
VAREVFGLLAHDFAKPFSYFGAIDVIVVHPACSLPIFASVINAGVVGRVYVDALNLSRIVGQQRLERDQVITLDYEISIARLTATEIWDIIE